jgi:hypothetical protein
LSEDLQGDIPETILKVRETEGHLQSLNKFNFKGAVGKQVSTMLAALCFQRKQNRPRVV